MSYTAPVKDMMYTMEHLAGLQTVTALPGMSDFDQETAQAVVVFGEEDARHGGRVPLADRTARLNRQL